MPVRIWGSNQIQPAITAAIAAVAPTSYNRSYLKPLPGSVVPVARPGGFKSGDIQAAGVTATVSTPADSYNSTRSRRSTRWTSKRPLGGSKTATAMSLSQRKLTSYK